MSTMPTLHKMGRRRPAAHPKLHMKEYRNTKTEIPVPAALNFTQKAAAALAQMDLNDVLGDCVIAAGNHLCGVATGNAGDPPFICDDATTIAQYSAIGGYDPNQTQPDGSNPTDNGCDEQTAFEYWKARGMADGTLLLGAVAVDATDVQACKENLVLCENLFIGFEPPAAWVTPFPEVSGFVWDVAGAPNPDNGHAVLVVGYNADGVLISTWGMIGLLTWAALAKYCVPEAGGELYALLTPDIVARGQNTSPEGINWLDLLEDFLDEGASIRALHGVRALVKGHAAAKAAKAAAPAASPVVIPTDRSVFRAPSQTPAPGYCTCGAPMIENAAGGITCGRVRIEVAIAVKAKEGK